MVQVAPGVKLPAPLLAKKMVSPTKEPKLPDTVAVQSVLLPTVTRLVAQSTNMVVVALVRENDPELPMLFESPP